MLKPTIVRVSKSASKRSVYCLQTRMTSQDMATRNNYYNEYWDRGKKSQWDGGEDITDKDRHREMYFDWAEETNRAIHPNRFGNVGNARRRYKNVGWGEQMEFQRIMRSICQGNYLNLTEEQMRAGCLGYMSEDDELMTREDDDFAVPYYKSSVVYRNKVLEDQCEGRPTYEWQIPAGADRYYGYKTVSTAVDVNYTDAINENDVYDWELTDEKIEMKGNHYILYNRSTDAKILVCAISDTQEAIEKFPEVDTCAINYAADMMLTSTDAISSPLTREDTELNQVLLGWTVFFTLNGWEGIPLTYAALCTATVLNILRTYVTPRHMMLKRLMKTCREKELHVVLGDWLTPDLVEREHHVSDQDISAIAERYNMFAIGNDSARGEYLFEGSKMQANWYKFLINMQLRGFINCRSSRMTTVEEFEEAQYPKTYTEACQDKRLDIFAHTVNNMETYRGVVGVQETRDLDANLAALMVQKRLLADIPVSVPLAYMEDHDRVSVAWQ